MRDWKSVAIHKTLSDLLHASRSALLLDVVVSAAVIDGSAQDLRGDAGRTGRGHRIEPITQVTQDQQAR